VLTQAQPDIVRPVGIGRQLSQVSIAIIVKVMLTCVGDIRNVVISIDNSSAISIGSSVEDKPPNGGKSSERPVCAKTGAIDLVID
jgi:hypothetical protein